MFRKRQLSHVRQFDPDDFEPVIRSSICTGERVAGFLKKSDNSFHEVILIRNDRDLEEFRSQYDVSGEIRVIY